MFKNRIRLPFFLSKPQFPVERNVFRKADGSSHLLSAIIRNTYEGKTDQLPEDWHRKLIIALAHKEVTIEDNRLLTDVVLDGDYGIDWQDFLNYPIAGATFTIQTTPFNASTGNCQSCAEITQLDLVDDYTDEVWGEGQTHEFSDIITANDTICCFPFTISISSFNSNYFESVTVDDAGVVTVVIKDPVPVLTDVLIATYRVTCENGGYDEANIYGNLDGSAIVCEPPTDLQVELDPEDGTTATISWTEPAPPPSNGYVWALYTTDIGTPVQGGNTSADEIFLTGLTPGTTYYFALNSECDDFLISETVTISFTTGGTIANSCGEFDVTYIPSVLEPLPSFSYMDCAGVVQTHVFTAWGTVTKCMLINPGSTTPIFFAAPNPEITINYAGLC